MDPACEACGAPRTVGGLSPETTTAMPDSAATSPSPARMASAAEVEAAIDRWGDAVLRLARSRMGNAADAEDVFQTVFLRLLQSAPRFADDEHAKAWLLRVTVNCCNDAHRAPWRRRAIFDEDAAKSIPAPEPPDADDERLDRLQEALSRLTGRQRAAVHLHYFEGYSTDEVAQITGERPATVRSHLHRARKALRIELGERP
ncbi:MAG TPA: sigma-70 family RNA polymerase sigma factor [Candidatus Rubneribacter avistercoris]|nr:sigma-70 family RNA polymerase sigma factor [Candidatus Rubneribacter avistercoris]